MSRPCQNTIFVILATFVVVCSGCRTWRAGNQDVDVAQARNLTFHGLNALHRGESGQAEGLLRQAADACPTDQRIRQHLATAMVENGSVDEAIEQLQVALEHSPHDPRLHVELGNLYFVRNQTHLANRHSDIALRIDRQASAAWELKAQCQSVEGELPKALSSYLRAASCPQSCPNIQLEIAKIYRAQNRPLQALNALNLYKEKFPADQVPIPAVMLMADAMSDLNQHQRAATVLAEATKRPDATEDTWLALSKTQAKLGDISEATFIARQAANRFPNADSLRAWTNELASRNSGSSPVDRTAGIATLGKQF